MNPGTDTRFVILDAETRTRVDRHHNNAESIYTGRHSTDIRAPFTPAPGRHHCDDSQTRLIPPIKFTAAVPLVPRPQVVETVESAPPEPAAPVTDSLLRRVLRGLRVMK